jgi:hypothetical protein
VNAGTALHMSLYIGKPNFGFFIHALKLFLTWRGGASWVPQMPRISRGIADTFERVADHDRADEIGCSLHCPGIRPITLRDRPVQHLSLSETQIRLASEVELGDALG